MKTLALVVLKRQLKMVVRYRKGERMVVQYCKGESTHGALKHCKYGPSTAGANGKRCVLKGLATTPSRSSSRGRNTRSQRSAI